MLKSEKRKEDRRRDSKRFYQKNKDRIREYKKDRLKTNINYKLAHYLRVRIRKLLRGVRKNWSFVGDLGCSIPELKEYLEKQFQEGMSWDNHNRNGWHIDHVKALANFDLSDRQQFLEACHYTNLQPLWAKDNIVKSNK